MLPYTIPPMSAAASPASNIFLVLLIHGSPGCPQKKKDEVPFAKFPQKQTFYCSMTSKSHTPEQCVILAAGMGFPITRVLLFVVVLFVFSLPAAMAEEPFLLRVMKEELARSFSILREKADPPPYFISYSITEQQVYGISATLGAI